MTIADLMKESDVPVVISDDKGLITYVNEKFESTFGWNISEIKGKTITVIIPERMREAHNRGFARFLMTKEAKMMNKPIKLKVMNKDLKEFDSENIIIAEELEGKWVLGSTIRPL